MINVNFTDRLGTQISVRLEIREKGGEIEYVTLAIFRGAGRDPMLNRGSAT